MNANLRISFYGIYFYSTNINVVCIGKIFILSRNIIQRNEIFIKWLSIVEDNNFLASNTVQTERVN